MTNLKSTDPMLDKIQKKLQERKENDFFHLKIGKKTLLEKEQEIRKAEQINEIKEKEAYKINKSEPEKPKTAVKKIEPFFKKSKHIIEKIKPQVKNEKPTIKKEKIQKITKEKPKIEAPKKVTIKHIPQKVVDQEALIPIPIEQKSSYGELKLIPEKEDIKIENINETNKEKKPEQVKKESLNNSKHEKIKTELKKHESKKMVEKKQKRDEKINLHKEKKEVIKSLTTVVSSKLKHLKEKTQDNIRRKKEKIEDVKNSQIRAYKKTLKIRKEIKEEQTKRKLEKRAKQMKEKKPFVKKKIISEDSILRKDPALLFSGQINFIKEKTEEVKSKIHEMIAKRQEAVKKPKPVKKRKEFQIKKKFSNAATEVLYKVQSIKLPKISLTDVLHKLRIVFKQSLHFTAVSLSIFIIAFVALNINAYSIRTKSLIAKLKASQTANITAPAENAEKIKKESPLPLSVIKNVTKLKSDIPALNIALAPPDYRLVIPKINVNSPVIQTDSFNFQQKDWKALEETILTDLENGVVHYPGTALPGQKGNVVITGHSSYYPWNKGRYKTIFAPLHDLEVGDELSIWYKQSEIKYKITERKIVKPNAVEVMQPTEDFRMTLVTCTPIGTTLKRLILVAQQV
jgi:LPXTG-site transpeptidase (sortase) family protein